MATPPISPPLRLLSSLLGPLSSSPPCDHPFQLASSKAFFSSQLPFPLFSPFFPTASYIFLCSSFQPPLYRRPLAFKLFVKRFPSLLPPFPSQAHISLAFSDSSPRSPRSVPFLSSFPIFLSHAGLVAPHPRPPLLGILRHGRFSLVCRPPYPLPSFPFLVETPQQVAPNFLAGRYLMSVAALFSFLL